MQLKQDQDGVRPRPARDPGRNATQAICNPGCRCDPSRVVSVCGFFFFFLLLCWCGFLLLLMNTHFLFFFFISSVVNTHFGFLSLRFILVVNRVLETWFPCRCHVEKVPHQTWTTHKNRVPKIWFIDPKSSLLDSNC